MTKLVRDKIPEIMKSENHEPKIHVAANDVEFLQFLQLKLLEEINEFIDASKSSTKTEAEEELADVLEVIETLCQLMKYDVREVQMFKNRKKLENGGFSQRTLLDL